VDMPPRLTVDVPEPVGHGSQSFTHVHVRGLLGAPFRLRSPG
jgi:hypothetical protein